MTTTAQAYNVLRQSWQTPSGILRLLTAVNHRVIGLRYIATGLLFFILAGIAALLMRVQLAFPENNFLNPALYNQLFTMHGTTMMFLFAVPIMEGIGIYIMPLMVGARDMAFPRLNAFGYWVYFIAGITLWSSLFIGTAPDGGWFAYVPLTRREFSPELGIDFYTTMITFLEVAALVAAIELIVTIFFMRAPGMAIHRMPLFVWAILVMAFMIMFAMPPLIVASGQLLLDRAVSTHFFNYELGGDPLLWQHLFWFFGHPEVYIILIPALGIVSAIVPTFSRQPLVGYVFVALSFVSVGFLSFGLWVHHMFTTGISPLGSEFFTVASMMIAIPSGVQIFATIATLWTGKVWLRTPLLFVLGFVFIFVLGGITGVMVASIPFDEQVHDSFFIVAHFHYVLIGGAVFPLFAGIYYWFPKVTGRMLSETIGKWNFWLLFIGFNTAFLPMHLLGLWGMPRRVYTYLPGLGWNLLNFIATVGAFLIGLGVTVLLFNVVKSYLRGEPAGNNPWQAGTLEWATASPPDPYNFAVIPTVRSRNPLWQEYLEESADGEDFGQEGEDPVKLSDERRETPGTSFLDAHPQQRVVLPGPSIIPFFAALAVAVTFLAMMLDFLLVLGGVVLTIIAFIAWQWPNARERSMDFARVGPPGALPTDHTGLSWNIYPPFFWGVVGLILIEITVFATLIASYLYLRASNLAWPPAGIQTPEPLLPGLGALVLLGSAVPIYWSDRRISQHGDVNALRWGYIIGNGMVIVFLVIRFFELTRLDFSWDTHAYGSIFWAMVGLHTLHGLSLLISSLVVAALIFLGMYNEDRFAAIRIDGVYWYFVAFVWLPVYAVLYLSPYVI